MADQYREWPEWRSYESLDAAAAIVQERAGGALGLAAFALQEANDDLLDALKVAGVMTPRADATIKLDRLADLHEKMRAVIALGESIRSALHFHEFGRALEQEARVAGQSFDARLEAEKASVTASWQAREAELRGESQEA